MGGRSGKTFFKKATGNITVASKKDDYITYIERYHELFEASRDGIASVDSKGRVIEFNSAFKSMVGYTDEEILSLTYEDLTPVKWHVMEKRILEEQVDKRGYSDLYEKEYIRKDGSIITVELRTYLRRDKEGTPCGYWAIVRDITEKRINEQNIIASEQLLQTIISNSPVGIGKVKDRIILWVNSTLCRLTGYTAEELKGMSTLLAYESQEEYERVGSIVYKEGFVETKIKRKDGTLFDAHIYLSPTNSHSFIFTLVDVTKQKEMERRLKVIFDHAFQFIGLLGVDGTLIDVNKTALDFIHAQERDVTGMLFWDTPWWRHSIESQNMIRNAIMRASKGDFVRLEVNSPGLDSKIRYFDFSIKPVKDEQDNVMSLIAEGRDITELKNVQKTLEQTEAALKESEQRLANIIQFLPDATFVIDSDGKVIIWNKAIEVMTGVKSEDMIGKGNYEYAIPFYGTRRPILIDLLLKRIRRLNQNMILY